MRIQNIQKPYAAEQPVRSNRTPVSIQQTLPGADGVPTGPTCFVSMSPQPVLAAALFDMSGDCQDVFHIIFTPAQGIPDTTTTSRPGTKLSEIKMPAWDSLALRWMNNYAPCARVAGVQ